MTVWSHSEAFDAVCGWIVLFVLCNCVRGKKKDYTVGGFRSVLQRYVDKELNLPPVFLCVGWCHQVTKKGLSGMLMSRSAAESARRRCKPIAHLLFPFRAAVWGGAWNFSAESSVNTAWDPRLHQIPLTYALIIHGTTRGHLLFCDLTSQASL